MSNKRVKTEFQGFDRQVFPDNLSALNNSYDKSPPFAMRYTFENPIRERIEELTGAEDNSSEVFINKKKINGEMVSEIVQERGLLTDDGYRWCHAFHFSYQRGKVAILFPYAFDRKKQHGTRLDRSISFHTQGEIESTQIDQLSRKILESLKSTEIKP